MNAPLIPQANPGAAFHSRRDALLKAAADVLDGGWYINGKQVRQFEESFAAFCSVKHAVGVGNGTDAIEVALRALGIGKGGLVFTVSHTAVATVAAIECAGATPVLVDVDPVTYTMSPESLAKALEAARAGRYPGKPAAVLPVHLYGGCADLDAIRAVAGDLPTARPIRAVPPGPPASPGRSAFIRPRISARWATAAASSPPTTPLPNVSAACASTAGGRIT